MAHRTLKRSSYEDLVVRLNRFPQGAPPSETLYRILRILVSEREAGLVALLPIMPFRAGEAATRWRMPEADARKVLEELAGRAILVDVERDGQSVYTLPPPMAGFFEFCMMRLRGDVNQKVLAELYYQYLNVEEDFIRSLFVDGETQLGRVYVNEPRFRRRTHCTCSTTSAQATRSEPPPTSAWVSATAGTRWGTWGRAVTLPWKSA